MEGAIPEKAWRDAYRDIVEFERTLADDGVAILKFFLHISRKEQKERFRAIEADPLEAWRVTAADWARHKKYNEYLAATEEMLELTESEFAPWTIVEATSKWYARKKIFETIVSVMEKRLGGHGVGQVGHAAPGNKIGLRCAPHRELVFHHELAHSFLAGRIGDAVIQSQVCSFSSTISLHMRPNSAGSATNFGLTREVTVANFSAVCARASLRRSRPM